MGYHGASRQQSMAHRRRAIAQGKCGWHSNHATAKRNLRRLAIVPDSSDGPTVLRILLGTHLRRLRETQGITARQGPPPIPPPESQINPIELGRTPPPRTSPLHPATPSPGTSAA